MLPAGLTVYPNFLTQEQQDTIIAWCDDQPWDTTLKRRTQQYGYLYNYSGKGLSPLTKTTSLSGPLLTIAHHLSTLNLGPENSPKTNFEQCIINDYFRAQGINKHSDSSVFGPIIISISLGSPAIMIFSRDNQKIPVVLEPGSLLMMTGEARYHWKHEISSNLTLVYPDGHKEIKPENYRRISLTYRTVHTHS